MRLIDARKTLATLMVAIGLLALTTCAQSAGQKPPALLGDLSGLKRFEGAKVEWAFVKPGLNLRRYSKLLIDQVKLIYHPDSDLADVDPADRERLREYFERAVVNAVGDAYPLVRRPGPHALHVRVAITNLRASRPVANIASTVLMKFSLFIGEVAIVGDLRDSLTGERLVAFADTESGRRILNPDNLLSHWGDVREAFEHWAALFGERLDEIHRRATKS